MLLEKTEELRELIELTTERLETIHAQYVRYFPKEIQELNELSAPRSGSEEGGDSSPSPQYEGRKDLQKVHNPIEIEITPPERDRQMREVQRIASKKQYKALLKKCLQLSHPDKIVRFPTITRRKLYGLFHEAKELTKEFDPSAASAIYIRICFLRDETYRISPEVMESLNQELALLEAHLQSLARHGLYGVLVEHQRGNIDRAKALFHSFLLATIARLREELDPKAA